MLDPKEAMKVQIAKKNVKYKKFQLNNISVQ